MTRGLGIVGLCIGMTRVPALRADGGGGPVTDAGAVYVLLGSSRAPGWEEPTRTVADELAGIATINLPWIHLHGAGDADSSARPR